MKAIDENEVSSKTEESPARFYVSMGPGGAALHAVGAALASLPNVSFGLRLPGATEKQAEDLAAALNEHGAAIFGLIVWDPETLDDMGVAPDEAFMPPSARIPRRPDSLRSAESRQQNGLRLPAAAAPSP